MTLDKKCHLCDEPIGEKFDAYEGLVWHHECLVIEALTDYVARQYGEYGEKITSKVKSKDG